jgi:hydroxypyruvate isomerase
VGLGGGIAAAGRAIKHCHVAECGTRSFPGDNPAAAARLEPYFAALKSIGYSGGVSCECNWGKGDIAKKLEKAFNTLKGMA